MSEVDEAMQGVSRTTMAYLTAAFAVAQMAARQQAQRLRESATQSDDDRRQTLRKIRAEAELQAGRWEAARRQGVDWVEAYASAIAWRELDPRAERAAAEIEEAMRSHGWEPPDDHDVRAETQVAREAAGWQLDADQHTVRGEHAEDRAGDPRSDPAERDAEAGTAAAEFADAAEAQIATDAAADAAGDVAVNAQGTPADVDATGAETTGAAPQGPEVAGSGDMSNAGQQPETARVAPAGAPAVASATPGQLGRMSHPRPVGPALAAAARGRQGRARRGRTGEATPQRDRGPGR